MQKREVACALLVATDGRLLLQRRDDKPGIEQPGKLGLFGGGRENEETFLACAVREVSEELGHLVSVDRFEYLGPHQEEGEERDIVAELFLVRGMPIEPLKVTEGSLEILGLDEIDAIQDELAPVTRVAIKLFLEKSGLSQ